MKIKKLNQTLYVSDKADEEGEVFLDIGEEAGIYLNRDDANKLADHLNKIYEPKEKPARESGFYWVRVIGDEWTIAQWSGIYSEWYVYDSESSFQDDEFFEIDERRIERCAEV